MKRALLGGAWNVQRRLIRYAVVVPAMKLIVLATLTCSPAHNSRTYRPKSTIAASPPVTRNRHICVVRRRFGCIGGSATRAAYSEALSDSET